MSDFVASVDALRTHLSENFSALPIYWPNDAREPTPKDAPAGFVYAEARLLDEGAAGIAPDGARAHRDTGEFTVYVFVPRKSKAGAAEQHAQAVRAVFSQTRLGDIVITRRVIGAGAPVDGPRGQWYGIPVVIDWFSDRTE